MRKKQRKERKKTLTRVMFSRNFAHEIDSQIIAGLKNE